MIIQQKWHQKVRNVSVDIVIIADKNLKQGEWRLGRVSKTEMGIDGYVRRITVAYKNKNSNIFTTVERAAQRVVVILPQEEQKVVVVAVYH